MINNKELLLQYNIISRNIKYYRKLLKLSQEQLAEVCDLSVSYVKQIESGKDFKNISFVVLFKLSNGLKIGMADLFKPVNIKNNYSSKKKIRQ